MDGAAPPVKNPFLQGGMFSALSDGMREDAQ